MDFRISEDGSPSYPELGVAWLRVQDPALPRDVHVRVAVNPDGRLICTGLLLAGAADELTARALRQIKVPDILEALTRPRKSPWLTAYLAQQPAAKRVRPGRRGYPDAHYRAVLKAHRQAKKTSPRAPIQAVMREFQVSEPTVHRWLRTAAARGLDTPPKPKDPK